MEEKKINKSTILSIVVILLVIIVVAGTTYAYFRAVGETETQEITTENLSLEIIDGTEVIDTTDIIPIMPNEVLEEGKIKTFTIRKTSNDKDLYVKIKLSSIQMDSELNNYDVKWALYKDTTPISTGDFGGKQGKDIVLATNQLITKTGSEYNLYFWINETDLDQSEMMDKRFKATIVAIGESQPQNTLASMILGENNANVITTTPTFSTTSTDRGLFMQQGDVTRSEMGFPTYYFRGSTTNTTINTDYVMNNYVKFGKYSTDIYNTIYIDGVKNKDKLVASAGEDILWRVMRINEDGSIRIISQLNLLDDIVWSNSNSSNYIGSIIKNEVDTWYENNKSQFDGKVVNSTFCHDSRVSTNINIDSSPSSDRMNNHKPSFICGDEAEKIYSKVGMLTTDDMLYSGALLTPDVVSNNTTYLNNNSDFWVGGARRIGYTYFWSQSTTAGRIATGGVGDDSAVRMVMNLSPDVVVTGTGTTEDPYVIK